MDAATRTALLECGPDFSACETALYRLYDAEDRLLYVGITVNLQDRMSDHQKQSWWLRVASRTVTLHASRREAAKAEMVAIHDEHPLLNLTGASRPAVVRRRPGRRRGPNRVPLTVRILVETDDRLTEAVEMTGQSPQYIVDAALAAYLDTLGI